MEKYYSNSDLNYFIKTSYKSPDIKLKLKKDKVNWIFENFDFEDIDQIDVNNTYNGDCITLLLNFYDKNMYSDKFYFNLLKFVIKYTYHYDCINGKYLYIIAKRGNLEFLKYFQKYVHQTLTDGYHLFKIIKYTNNLEMIKYYEELKWNKLRYWNKSFLNNNNLEIIKYIIDKDETNFFKNENNILRAMENTCNNKNLEIFKYYTTKLKNFDLDKINNIFTYATSVSNNHFEIVNYLLSKGADPDKATLIKKSKDCYNRVISQDIINTNLLKILLESNANINLLVKKIANDNLELEKSIFILLDYNN